jgi:hypothetical protein
MAKKFTARASALTADELHGLLKLMPVRTLMRLAEFHKVETTRETVARDLAKSPKCFTIITFTLGFNI